MQACLVGTDGSEIVVMCPIDFTAEELLSRSLVQLRSLVCELEKAQTEIARERTRLKPSSGKMARSPEQKRMRDANGSAPDGQQETKVIGLYHPSQLENSIASTGASSTCKPSVSLIPVGIFQSMRWSRWLPMYRIVFNAQ